MSTPLQEAIAQLTSPGQMFEITELEVRGATVKAWAGAPTSLRDIWLNSAGYGDADYLVYQDERWTYQQAHEEVQVLAHEDRHREVRAEHEELAMGEVQHVGALVDQHEAEGDDRVDRAEGQTTDDQLQIDAGVEVAGSDEHVPPIGRGRPWPPTRVCSASPRAERALR